MCRETDKELGPRFGSRGLLRAPLDLLQQQNYHSVVVQT